MAPKKGKKMALGDFLGDSALGSWADEMEALPTAPTGRTDEDRFRDRDSRRDFTRDRDFPPREFSQREELPLPSAPPYMAFVGNLSFDVLEEDVTDFFAPLSLNSIKIIKDRDGKPKGFGYVEFDSLEGLKDGLSRSGASLANRPVRVSVAEPPKERTGFGGDERLSSGTWRREGPLPSLEPSSSSRGPGFSPRGPSAEVLSPSVADTSSDWRSNRTPRAPPPPERSAPLSRRESTQPQEPSNPAIGEPTWERGSKFQPAPPSVAEGGEQRRSLFGGRGRGDAVSPSGTPGEEENNWRSGPRRTLSHAGSQRDSPTTSTPPTPQLARKKLELLPRGSASPSGSTPASPNAASGSTKPNPFGAAKPIDVSARDKEIEEKVAKDREARVEALAKAKEAAGSGASQERSGPGPRSTSWSRASKLPETEIPDDPATKEMSPSTSAPAARREFATGAGAIRPAFSFAAAAGKPQGEDGASSHVVDAETDNAKSKEDGVEQLTDTVAELSL